MLKFLINSVLGKLGYKLNRIVPYEQTDEFLAIARGKQIINRISPDYTVLNGPFRGMKYPSIDITELTLVPKIIGSYEAQLSPLIDEISSNYYDHIIDIGCAEGYYAVGMAIKFPRSTVHCYDINQRDLQFCRQMAELNGVSNLTFNNFCSPDTLKQFNYGIRSLIICDCEGYEIELFTPEVVASLTKTEVLVEMHDVLNPKISETLLQRFADSHTFKVFNNCDLDFSDLVGLEILKPEERAYGTFEHRGGVNRNIFMEWAYFQPKRNQAQNAQFLPEINCRQFLPHLPSFRS